MDLHGYDTLISMCFEVFRRQKKIHLYFFLTLYFVEEQKYKNVFLYVMYFGIKKGHGTSFLYILGIFCTSFYILVHNYIFPVDDFPWVSLRHGYINKSSEKFDIPYNVYVLFKITTTIENLSGIKGNPFRRYIRKCWRDVLFDIDIKTLFHCKIVSVLFILVFCHINIFFKSFFCIDAWFFNYFDLRDESFVISLEISSFY